MFKQSTKDKINGWGSAFRFITPILLTVALFILTGIKEEIKEVKCDTTKRFDKVDLQFSNHLEHHRQYEVILAERMTRIETKIRGLR